MDPGDIREGLQEVFSLISILSDKSEQNEGSDHRARFREGRQAGRLRALAGPRPCPSEGGERRSVPEPRAGVPARPGHLSVLCESVLGAGAAETPQPQLPRAGVPPPPAAAAGPG